MVSFFTDGKVELAGMTCIFHLFGEKRERETVTLTGCVWDVPQNAPLCVVLLVDLVDGVMGSAGECVRRAGESRLIQLEELLLGTPLG